MLIISLLLFLVSNPIGRIYHKVAMALARNYRRIDPFQPDNETIAAYLERVELYFQANDIRDEKVLILLTSIGDKTYTLLRNHFAAAKPAEKTLANIDSALRKLFEPPKIVIAEQFVIRPRTKVFRITLRSYEGSELPVILVTFSIRRFVIVWLVDSRVTVPKRSC